MNPLDLIEAPLRAVLEFFHSIGFTWGWAIVMLTLLVRLILLPLFVKQYKSARRMQEVAPEMKELQRKYKGNKQKLQEEMMKFYKENDVNPFGSCLPLLLQAPVFIALYFTLRDANFADGTDQSFLGAIPDISLLLTEIGWAVIPLVAVYAVSQLISTELSAMPTMSKNQRWLMRLLPIGIVFFIFQFPVPAGLVIYWATTNLWTAGQQLVLKRRIEAEIEAKGGSLIEKRSPVPEGAAALVDDDDSAASDGDVADDSAPAPTGQAAATEDVQVRGKGVPKRRRKGAAAQGSAKPDGNGTEANAAGEQESTTTAGSDAAIEASTADADTAPTAGSSAEPGGNGPGGGQQKGKKKRKPAPRKVSGGPSRPASRKPPKRRK